MILQYYTSNVELCKAFEQFLMFIYDTFPHNLFDYIDSCDKTKTGDHLTGLCSTTNTAINYAPIFSFGSVSMTVDGCPPKKSN